MIQTFPRVLIKLFKSFGIYVTLVEKKEGNAPELSKLVYVENLSEKFPSD